MVAVTCHYIDEGCNLVEALLDFSPVHGEHSGYNLATKLFGILEEFDIIAKINCITSDSASNNNRMVKELEHMFRDRKVKWLAAERHIPCITHIINIAVQEFMKSIKLRDDEADDDFPFSELLTNVRDIALHIKKSSQAWDKFQAICNDLEIKALKILIDVVTRWNSTHRMLERVLYLRKAIDRYVLDHQPELTPITEKQWEMLELLCGFLWPFKHCTEALESTKKPEVDRVYWVYNRMFNEIDDFKSTLERREGRNQPWSKALLTALIGMEFKLKKYYEKTGTPSVYVDAMILNPKVKLSGFRGPEWDRTDAEEYRKQARARYMENYASLPLPEPAISLKRKAHEMEHGDGDNGDSDNGDGDGDNGDDYDRYISSTFIETTTEAVNEFDAWIAAPRQNAKCTLSWWSRNWRDFPRLAMMMRDACAVPPSGSGVERQFSIAGRVATWQRNRLSPQSICNIMFYKNHMDRMGVKLDICCDAVCIAYETIIEADVEDVEEAVEAVRTISDWRGMWNNGMKRR
jgi:hAT family protein